MTAAVLDACVLYSAFLRDLFMRLAVGFVFQPKWTAQIHDEWMRNVLLNRPDLTRAQLERTRTLMEKYGHDWDVGEYEPLIPTLTLPDADDRHVLAAAIAAQVPVIVTFNLSDFPASALSPYGVRALHPDVYLFELLDTTPDAFVGAIHTHRTALKNPPCTQDEYLARFVENGLHTTSARLKEWKDQI
jgi:hypothetical protein